MQYGHRHECRTDTDSLHTVLGSAGTKQLPPVGPSARHAPTIPPKARPVRSFSCASFQRARFRPRGSLDRFPLSLVFRAVPFQRCSPSRRLSATSLSPPVSPWARLSQKASCLDLAAGTSSFSQTLPRPSPSSLIPHPSSLIPLHPLLVDLLFSCVPRASHIYWPHCIAGAVWLSSRISVPITILSIDLSFLI